MQICIVSRYFHHENSFHPPTHCAPVRRSEDILSSNFPGSNIINLFLVLYTTAVLFMFCKNKTELQRDKSTLKKIIITCQNAKYLLLEINFSLCSTFRVIKTKFHPHKNSGYTYMPVCFTLQVSSTMQEDHRYGLNGRRHYAHL
jgi:hypothetical protein